MTKIFKYDHIEFKNKLFIVMLLNQEFFQSLFIKSILINKHTSCKNRQQNKNHGTKTSVPVQNLHFLIINPRE